MERKIFLKAFVAAAAAGPMVLKACKKETNNPSGSTTTSTAGTTTTSANGACVTSPTEVEGPYPYPGGELTNPLSRIDITDGQTGVPLTLNLLVVNVNANCNVVSNARVDIWHCNKDGYYSGYGNQNSVLGNQSYIGKTWLRGYQTSDDKGLVKFITIYPGWYSGRATHIHFEVFINNVLKKTGQMAFSEAINNEVHISTLYAAHGKNTTSNMSDGIFGNSAADLANETVSLVGSVSAGYTGTYTIGLAL